MIDGLDAIGWESSLRAFRTAFKYDKLIKEDTVQEMYRVLNSVGTNEQLIFDMAKKYDPDSISGFGMAQQDRC